MSVVQTQCAFCNQPMEITSTRYKRSKSGYFFCSKEHKDEAARIGSGISIHPKHFKERNPCPACGKLPKRRQKFCNQQCFNDFRKEGRQLKIQEWQEGKRDGHDKTCQLLPWAKEFLEEIQEGKCALCNRSRWKNKHYNGPIPLHADHINGNPTDGRFTNFRLICPTCHQTTPTWGSRNNGNGRQHRQR